ncbi:MAG TPA: MBL fold metallo-hydrolase, partial [Candidatus Hodarchaeales archaeon]|nr:MBL fold metallo-hydrolase [Candidatus Hodarchaeales archaeon]
MTEIIEWADRVYRIQAGSFGSSLDTAYIVDCGEKVAVIDTGSSELCGRGILKGISESGHKVDDIGAIFLTHAHPDHLGGLRILSQAHEAKLFVHKNAQEIFEKGRNYALEKQFNIRGAGDKVALAFRTPIMSNYNKLPTPVYIDGTEDITVGDETFVISSAGGHCADHILIHAYQTRSTFIGDELGVAEGEFGYFFDLTGSPEQRKKSIKLMAKLKSEFLYPAHLPPIEKTDIPRITEEALLSQSHFETTVMETLINYGKARLDTLVTKIRQTLNIEWQTPFRELEVDETTLLVYLNG